MLKQISFWLMMVTIGATLFANAAFTLVHIVVAVVSIALIIALRFVAREEGRRGS